MGLRRTRKDAQPFAGRPSLARAQPRTSVTLTPYTSGAFRWKDVAGNLYAMAFRESYSYTQSTVVITYHNRGDALRGTLQATNLKPHFAYQLKLSGLPESDTNSNENLGFSGR